MSFPYYRWFPGDYARDTGHLTMLQHGAYRLLLDTYMATGKPIRGDLHALHRICGALSGEERQAVEFVLAEFFIQEGPVWRNFRCDRELNYLTTLSEHGRNAAAMRWHSDGNAHAMQKHSDGNARGIPTRTRTRKELKAYVGQKTPDELLPGFVAFWTAYPSKRRVAKAKCRTTWKANRLEPLAATIVAHVTAMRSTQDWRDGYNPAPATYLNQRRWEDELPELAGKTPDGKLKVAL
jgi:uncharacterized protein YdaU (DUF1376 family)